MSDWIGPITFYGHDETDEESGYYTDEIMRAHPDWPKDLVAALHYNNPLYEVGFTFYINPETKQYKVTEINFGEHQVACDLILGELHIDA